MNIRSKDEPLIRIVFNMFSCDIYSRSRRLGFSIDLLFSLSVYFQDSFRKLVGCFLVESTQSCYSTLINNYDFPGATDV